ncbi:MAG TPA: lysylphosphatidylglycerol synthase transmembrane domain-containing protein [Dehalococcoidia bacterium]|nr:lysylphosphatidylglycerol synthase transmembrane domain-containing protein [Dehalococcoidia bacterium]
MLKSRGFWIGMGVTAALVAWFVWRNWDRFPDMKRAFQDADWRLALLALPIYFAGLFVRTLRWQYLLRPVKKVGALRLFPVVIVGLMANNILPARAGELARAYVLGQREQISKTTSLGTIAVDRLFDGVTLIPMMLICAAIVGDQASFPVFGYDLNFAGLGIVMAVLFGVALGVLFYLALSDRGRHLLHRIVHRFAPARLKPHVETLLHSFFEGLHALRSPVDLAAAWVMSLISWTLEATMYFVVARAFGIHENFAVFLLLTAAANLAIAVVATQGGVGAFELVVSKTIIAFAAAGAAQDTVKRDAAAYAIGLHALLLVPIVVIGLLIMWMMDLRFSDMLKSGDGEPVAPADADAARVVRVVKPAVEGTGRK